MHLALHTLVLSSNIVYCDADKKFLIHNVRKNNRITSFVPFDPPPPLASSPPSVPGPRSLALKIRETLQEANTSAVQEWNLACASFG